MISTYAMQFRFAADNLNIQIEVARLISTSHDAAGADDRDGKE